MKRNVKTFSNEICYRGHIISNGGICKEPHKLKVIEDGPQPKNLYEVRNFIFMYLYYRCS